jgi:hypothetical protein
MSVYLLVSNWVALQPYIASCGKTNLAQSRMDSSNANCVFIGYIYIYIIRLVCVDHVWLTGHLWKSEYTVCAG